RGASGPEASRAGRWLRGPRAPRGGGELPASSCRPIVVLALPVCSGHSCKAYALAAISRSIGFEPFALWNFLLGYDLPGECVSLKKGELDEEGSTQEADSEQRNGRSSRGRRPDEGGRWHLDDGYLHLHVFDVPE